MKSRRERRAEARENKTSFEPEYKGRVITKAEYDKEVAELKEQRKQSNQAFKRTSQEVEETITEKATE
jgi:hypothetical protein